MTEHCEISGRPFGSTGLVVSMLGFEMGVFDVFQGPYSAVQRDHHDAIHDAAGAGAGVLIRGSTARGATIDDKNCRLPPYRLDADEAHDRWESAELNELLDGMGRHEFMLRYTLSHAGVSSPIVGTSSCAYLRTNAEIASRGALPESLYEIATARLRSHR